MATMFDPKNTVDTGIRGPKALMDPLKANFPEYGSGHLFRGLNWAGLFDGSLAVQGSFPGRDHPWRAANFKITAQGGAGTTLVPAVNTFPASATFVTRATADGDGYNLQWTYDGGTTVAPLFAPAANTLIIGYFRLKLDNAANDAHTKGRFYLGIGDADTAIHGSVSKFLGLYKASGAATVKGILDDGAQTLSTETAAVVNDTFIQLGFRVEGVSKVSFWTGTGTRVGDMTNFSNGTIALTNLPTANMALSIEGQTSEAAAITYTLEQGVVFQQIAM